MMVGATNVPTHVVAPTPKGNRNGNVPTARVGTAPTPLGVPAVARVDNFWF